MGTLLATLSTVGAWGGRPPSGEDVAGHLVRLEFGIREIVAHGRLDGWMPRFYLGYEEFLFNGPGLAWLVAMLQVLGVGALSTTGGLTLATVLMLAVLPAAVAFFARSIGLGRGAAGLAAVLCLLADNPFGVGLHGLYGVGLIPHQLGAPMFFVAFGAMIRVVDHPHRRWIVLAAVALTGLALTHLISLGILAVLLPIALAAVAYERGLSLDGLGRLGLALGLFGALGAAWLLPLWGHRDLRGAVATWGTPPLGTRVRDIVEGDILFRPYTATIVLAAWAYGLWRVVRHRRHAALVLVLPVAGIVVAHAAAGIRWPSHELTAQLANRALGYLGIVAVLPLAAVLAGAARVTGQHMQTRAGWGSTATYVVALGTAGWMVMGPLGPDREVVQQLPEPVAGMRTAAAILRGVVPDGARFATQKAPSEVETTGMIAPERWLAWASGRNSLNGFNIESSTVRSGPFEADRLGRLPAGTSADALARLGVTHVVTVHDGRVPFLVGSGRFGLVWSGGQLAVLEVRPAAGQPPPSSLLSTDEPATATMLQAAPEHLRIRFVASATTDARVAIAWSPKWHASIDGRPARLRRTPATDAPTDNVLALRLPAGDHVLRLDFRPDAWDHVGLAISLAAIVTVIAWWARGRR